MRIALIPARGGSKRIPRKNIRPFHGRPMIGWPIAAAVDSGLFDRVVVSTDDAEIAEIAQQMGAEVPFMRPAELADDFTPTRDVIVHAIETLGGVDQLCCIYATAAFVTSAHLKTAHELLTQDFVFAAASYAHPVQRAMIQKADGGVEMLYPEHTGTRSQDLPEAFHDAGQFYWGSAEAFVARRPMFGPASTPYILDRRSVQDIDTPEDWDVAEAMFKAMQLG